MILLYLASHGSVCNNQKETAINSAFALMTNNMQVTKCVCVVCVFFKKKYVL